MIGVIVVGKLGFRCFLASCGFKLSELFILLVIFAVKLRKFYCSLFVFRLLVEVGLGGIGLLMIDGGINIAQSFKCLPALYILDDFHIFLLVLGANVTG